MKFLDFVKFIEEVTISKISSKPLMIDVRNSNLLQHEKIYYQKFFGKNKAHGIILSSIDQNHVNFFVITSWDLKDRFIDNKLKFTLSNGKEGHLVMYKISLIELFKLIITDDTLETEITYALKKNFLNIFKVYQINL